MQRVAHSSKEGPNHKVLFLSEQLDNGTYIISEKLRHKSQAQRRVTASGASGIAAEMQEVLDVHNMYRCMHGVPSMTWDEDIAANAQAWADAGNYEHSRPEDRDLPNIGEVGENLAWGYPTRTGLDSVEAWYDEIVDTDGTPDNCGDATSPGKAVCHYTQVVWMLSTKLGCGKGKAKVTYPSATYDGDFWVCQYGPAGNYNGEFASNVLAPSKTADECAAPAAPTPDPNPPGAPPLEEATISSNCQDGADTDDPVIKYMDGSAASCADLEWACPFYSFVVAKCKVTCGSC